MKQTSVIEQLSALYTNALDKVFSHINTVLTQISMSYIVSLLTIYFLLVGYKFIIGDMDKAKKNLFRVFVYLPLMMTLVLNYDMYLEMIVIPTMTLKVYVVELINNIGSATTNGNNFKQLDVIFNNMYNFATNNYWSSNFIYSAKEHIMGWLVIIVYGLLYVTIAYYLLKSLVATSLFLMIGIIPLLFFAFDGTKSITAAWFKALVTYWLYAPISAFFMIFIYWVSHATSTNLNTDFSSFFLMVISGLTMNLLIKDIPEYANALTSSMSSAADGGSTALKWGKMGASSGGKMGLSAGKMAVGFAKSRMLG